MSQRPPRRDSRGMVPIGEIISEVMRDIVKRAIEAGNPPPQEIIDRFAPPPTNEDHQPPAPTPTFH